jgi:hypothetical protein
VAAAQRAVADGCADALVLRHGGGDAGRTGGRREHHGGAAQPRIRRGAFARRAALRLGFGWPLLLGGALKAGYDLALLASFRRVRPPEEV